MNTSSHSRYLDLLKRYLIDYQNIGTQEYIPIPHLPPTWKIRCLGIVDRLLRKRNFGLLKIKKVLAHQRLNGYDWPARAKTMVGLQRLTHVEKCVRSVVEQQIPGDFVEMGVWRGGVIMLMAALIDVWQIYERKIWAFDSFQGLPPPDLLTFPLDEGNSLHTIGQLSASLEEVKKNFRDANLSIEHVKFKKGWFKHTLTDNDVERISVLRLDGDLYESTFLSLHHLYPKLSTGGYLIIDDYHAFEPCKQAVDAYRDAQQISDPIIRIDREAVYWQKIT